MRALLAGGKCVKGDTFVKRALRLSSRLNAALQEAAALPGEVVSR